MRITINRLLFQCLISHRGDVKARHREASNKVLDSLLKSFYLSTGRHSSLEFLHGLGGLLDLQGDLDGGVKEIGHLAEIGFIQSACGQCG